MSMQEEYDALDYHAMSDYARGMNGSATTGNGGSYTNGKEGTIRNVSGVPGAHVSSEVLLACAPAAVPASAQAL